MIHGNEETFKNDVKDGIVLVDFFATWCGPCKMLSPILEELASDRNNIKFVKMDVDENPNIAKEFGSTVDDIVRTNGIENPDQIQVGQKLYIPKYVRMPVNQYA